MGSASGFQSVYERFRKHSATVSGSLPGLIYLLSRGIVPALIFIGLYHFGKIGDPLWLWALGCGMGAETVLRSKIYLYKGRKNEDILRGGLDLLRWYQNLFLDVAGDVLSITKIKFVKDNLPAGASFQELLNRVSNHLSGLTDLKIQAALREAMKELREKFDAETRKGEDPARLEEHYRYQICYIILDKGGKKIFQSLLSK